MIMIRYRLASLLLALTLGGAGAAVVQAVNACPDPVTTGSEAHWRHLKAEGWHGDPTDSMEALHAPGC